MDSAWGLPIEGSLLAEELLLPDAHSAAMSPPHLTEVSMVSRLAIKCVNCSILVFVNCISTIPHKLENSIRGTLHKPFRIVDPEIIQVSPADE